MTSDDADIAMAISAALYVTGDSLDPSRVTSLLGVEPTEAWSKDEVISRPDREPKQRKNGGWALRVHADSRDPSAALRMLLDQLNGHTGDVYKLAEVEDAYFDLFMAQQRGSPDAFVQLSPDTLGDLHRSGLALCLTFCETSSES